MLHELMHTNLITSGSMTIDAMYNGVSMYGSQVCHLAARDPIGVGLELTSQNADIYAYVASVMFWKKRFNGKIPPPNLVWNHIHLVMLIWPWKYHVICAHVLADILVVLYILHLSDPVQTFNTYQPYTKHQPDKSILKKENNDGNSRKTKRRVRFWKHAVVIIYKGEEDCEERKHGESRHNNGGRDKIEGASRFCQNKDR